MFNLITHKINDERSDYLYTHFLLETIGSALCKRPITRCIASLQSSSYTVFKQKIGEDFL